MNTGNEKNEMEISQSAIQAILKFSKSEKTKLIEELWEFCRKYPNDSDLGKNLRSFILLKSMSH